MKEIHVAIACGGTGGHLFPGLAVAASLRKRGAEVSLLVSPKEVDQEAIKSVKGMEVVTLPAVGLAGRNLAKFLVSAGRSYGVARRFFRGKPPQAVLAMGGFTSAPPILAGRSGGAVTFVHESNTIPGRANRWLARVVDQVFVGFPEAGRRLSHKNVVATGTPVRESFRRGKMEEARIALGLAPDRPVLLVTGGSQGAKRINELVLQAAPGLVAAVPRLQILHLTGLDHDHAVRGAYQRLNIEQVVTRAFLGEMELALGAATVVVARAGASSLAELAAMRVPSILVPYRAAVGNHQYHNARAFSDTGAALLIEEADMTGEDLGSTLIKLLEDRTVYRSMQDALTRWDAPRAADLIADKMLELVAASGSRGSEVVRGSRETPSVGNNTQSVTA